MRGSDWLPAVTDFGPHIRDLVVSADGSLALLNTMNWDHNLYAVDVGTGQVRWRQRTGDYFAFAPQTAASGFAVQGFDFESAEGYHLYLVKPGGRLERRFALYGLPKRLPHRFVPGIFNDRINNFAVPEDGSWVASAGDLGLAVWDHNGKLLWSQDWWKSRRHTARLAALSGETLLALEGMKAEAYGAVTGKTLWQRTLADTGEVLEILLSLDGKTVAVLATTEGGRLFILRDGKVIHALPVAGASAAALSPDGSQVAVVAANQLRLLDVAGGLQWTLPADDVLHYPRFAADGKRIAVCSELGTVYVVDANGKILLERDQGALTVPSWLADGDLLLGTWMGMMCRLDGQYAERWRTRLEPAATDMRGKLLAHDSTPTSRIEGWGNAEPHPAALTPNLLEPKNVLISFKWPAASYVHFVHDPALLVDGKAAPPPKPWLEPTAIGRLAEGTHTTWIQLDTFFTRLRVTGITLVEDPAHPESWLRDAEFEFWDAVREQWVPVQPLLSNAAVHTHRFAQPVEASRFRLVLPRWLVGNLRLAQIVLHGEKLGPSHPDVIARRPVAVLFDEGEDLKESLAGLGFRFEGAYSGGRCLTVPANRFIYPAYQPPFGHSIPNWDFEVAEKPEPGQYRYLQFAWRALEPQTRGMLLRVDGDGFRRSVSCYAGEYKPEDDALPRKSADTPPAEWQVVRVDLWDVFRKPVRIHGLRLGSTGGAAAFDQILLGRTEKDLENAGKAP
jgi:outer membrane protein assembly factor BamB